MRDMVSMGAGCRFCKMKSWRRVVLLVLVTAAVTSVMYLDVTQELTRWRSVPLRDFNASGDAANGGQSFLGDYRVTQDQGEGTHKQDQGEETLKRGKSKETHKEDQGEGTHKEDQGEQTLKEDQGEGTHKQDQNFLLPTRPRASNQELYQKDTIQQLNNTWTEEMRAAWLSVLKERHTKLQEACRNSSVYGGSEPNHSRVLGNNLVWLTKHQLVWCPIFKAASTTWVKNVLLIAGKKVINRSLHAQVRQLYPPPATEQERTKTLNNSMRMIVVRHPFERLLSAYRDKMMRIRNKDDPFVSQQQEIAHSYTDPGGQPIPYTAAELQKASSSKHKNNNKKASSGKHKHTSLVHPTFTQFLKKVRDDISRRRHKVTARVNGHWQPFWLQCNPCRIDYDIIARVETLMEDQEFIIRELGLENVLKPAHTHASRFDSYSSTSEAAKTYFKQVPLNLLESLATLFKPDFELFGYSPDKYLDLAAAATP